MFSNKIDLPYCLVVFFVVCPRLRPFWSVFGELACFWCSTAKIKTRQHRDFRSNQECPSLEANNSTGKLPPGLNSSTHSKQRCCSSMSIHSIRNTSHRSFTSDAFISCSIGFPISNWVRPNCRHKRIMRGTLVTRPLLHYSILVPRPQRPRFQRERGLWGWKEAIPELRRELGRDFFFN